MLIFNTTLHLDESVHSECLTFLKETYAPRALEGGMLEQASLARIESRHEENGVSYALQFKTQNLDVLDEWAATTGSELQKLLVQKFGSKVSGFVTLLEEIEL
ncbi:MAG: hypothetical protein RL662_169 [Bacteroidota bacterium]|jgi:hypothetical protein